MKDKDFDTAPEGKNGLTGLLRKDTFLKVIFPNFNECIEMGEPNYSFVVVDIDNFKAFNDLDGLAQGDYVLKGIGKILKLLQEQKTGYCISCRYGGEEFGLALQGLPPCETIEIAESIRIGVKSYQYQDAKTCSPRYKRHVTASIGVTNSNPSMLINLAEKQRKKEFELMLNEADMAMKYAKFKGKDRVEYCSEEVKDEMQKIDLARSLYFGCSASSEKLETVADHPFMEENPELRERLLFHLEFARRELTADDTRILARLADNFYSSIYSIPEKKHGFLRLIQDVL